MGLCVSLLRPFARWQQAGGFNLAITSLQCRREVPWGPERCLPDRPSACPPGPGNSNRGKAVVARRSLTRQATALRMLALVVVCPMTSRVINQCT